MASAMMGGGGMIPENKMIFGESPKGDAPNKNHVIRNNHTKPTNFKKSTAKN